MKKINQRRVVIEIKKAMTVVAETVLFEQATKKTLKNAKIGFEEMFKPFVEKKLINSYDVKINFDKKANALCGQAYLSFSENIGEFVVLDFTVSPVEHED